MDIEFIVEYAKDIITECGNLGLLDSQIKDLENRIDNWSEITNEEAVIIINATEEWPILMAEKGHIQAYREFDRWCDDVLGGSHY